MRTLNQEELKYWCKEIFDAASDKTKEVLIRVVVNEGVEANVGDACLVEMVRWLSKAIEDLRGDETEKSSQEIVEYWTEQIFDAADDKEKEVLVKSVVDEGLKGNVGDTRLVKMIMWQNKIIEKLKEGKDEGKN